MSRRCLCVNPLTGLLFWLLRRIQSIHHKYHCCNFPTAYCGSSVFFIFGICEKTLCVTHMYMNFARKFYMVYYTGIVGHRNPSPSIPNCGHCGGDLTFEFQVYNYLAFGSVQPTVIFFVLSLTSCIHQSKCRPCCNYNISWAENDEDSLDWENDVDAVDWKFIHMPRFLSWRPLQQRWICMSRSEELNQKLIHYSSKITQLVQHSSITYIELPEARWSFLFDSRFLQYDTTSLTQARKCCRFISEFLNMQNPVRHLDNS